MAKEGDILSTTEQTHQQDLERLKALRYMDDDFMTVCLADNFEGVELILRIVLGQEDIKIKSIRIQEPLKNLQGRSAILDVHAIDSTKKEFDVEIQRSDAGAGAKRARHNSSLLDAHILKSGDDTEDIPDSYVIFITENDVMGKTKPYIIYNGMWNSTKEMNCLVMVRISYMLMGNIGAMMKLVS